jgi:hypothetical protein
MKSMLVVLTPGKEQGHVIPVAGLHGGSVAARSDGPGGGAEFIIHLPASSRGGRTSPPPCPPGSL